MDKLTRFAAQVDIDWSKPEFQEGEKATLTIKTAPKSLCSISIIDEATKFKTSDNFNKRALVDRLTYAFRPYYYYQQGIRCANETKTEPLDIYHKWRPKIQWDKDTSTIFTVSRNVEIRNF